MAMMKRLRFKACVPVSVIAALALLTACQTTKVDPLPGDRIGMVLMHGKGGTPKYVSSLGSALRGAGVLVETPSMPWSRHRIYDKGYEESMDEIDTYVAQLKAAGARRIFVAGHSLGANAALGFGARREGLSGIILLAYGHVPGIPGFARKLFESTDHDRRWKRRRNIRLQGFRRRQRHRDRLGQRCVQLVRSARSRNHLE
jgi:pimeloyl-ACP methyl ester carboxylesterase